MRSVLLACLDARQVLLGKAGPFGHLLLFEPTFQSSLSQVSAKDVLKLRADFFFPREDFWVGS